MKKYFTRNNQSVSTEPTIKQQTSSNIRLIAKSRATHFLLLILTLFFASNLIPHSLAEASNQKSPSQCANDKCTVDKLILNTGYDQVAGTTYSPVQPDGYWNLTASPNTNLSTPTPVWVINPDPAWGVLPGSQWISAYNVASWNTNNPAPLKPYSFERCFCTCEEVNAVTIDFTMLVDDVAEVYFDNGSTPIFTVSPISTSNFHLPGNSFKKTFNVKPGSHCLRIDVRNAGGVAMGLDLTGTITSNPPGKPLLLSAACCSPSGKIIGRKINDKNCNGKNDNLTINQLIEPGLQGWAITVTNTATGATSTATTDANGFYYFNNLPPGTYTVSEQMQSGWSQTIPGGSGTYTVTLAAGQVFQGDFGNCNSQKPCVTVNSKDIICKPGSLGSFTYSFDVMNNSGVTVQAISLTPPDNSSFTLTPQQITLPTPLTNNSSTNVTVEIGNATQGQLICFTVALLDQEFRLCGCSGEVCINLPTCNCAQFIESKVNWEASGFVWHFTVSNQSSFTFTHMYVIGPVTPTGTTITPSYFSIGIPPLGTYTGTATITGVAPGSTVCFNIGFYDPGLRNCCILRKHCLKIPKNNPQ